MILIIQFLTRIPLPNQEDVTEAHFASGLKFFPVAGTLIGAILCAFAWLLQHLFGSLNLFSIVLIVFAGIVITGGLHLDGLADSFDGLYSNRSKERMLEIMKDSRIGANGVLALIGLIVIKISALVTLLPHLPIAALFLMPVYARFNVLVLCYKAQSARENGMGNFFIGKVGKMEWLFGSAVTLLASLVYPMALILLVCQVLLTISYRIHVTGRIGGLTGDIIGASIELNELFYVMGLVLFQQILI